MLLTMDRKFENLTSTSQHFPEVSVDLKNVSIVGTERADIGTAMNLSFQPQTQRAIISNNLFLPLPCDAV